MSKDKNKKRSTARSKGKPQKLSVKKEPIRDLDLSELQAKQVKGGATYRAIRTED